MRRRCRRASRGLALLMGLALARASGAEAQLSDPCGARCSLLLAGSSIVVATGTTAAIGRARGGFRTIREAAVLWGPVLLATAGAGVALSGDGARQRRAIHAAALGGVAGSLTGLAVESLSSEDTGATRIVATLLGGAVGVVAGGIVGAVTYHESGDPHPPNLETSIFFLRIPL